ncbi:hypothetical protein HYW21_06730 [Candidatus Woesearchaeota archaeon]|nr:hypothetical protein [Candidatus Woesearchaeota archaeon]
MVKQVKESAVMQRTVLALLAFGLLILVASLSLKNGTIQLTGMAFSQNLNADHVDLIARELWATTNIQRVGVPVTFQFQIENNGNDILDETLDVQFQYGDGSVDVVQDIHGLKPKKVYTFDTTHTYTEPGNYVVTAAIVKHRAFEESSRENNKATTTVVIQ